MITQTKSSTASKTAVIAAVLFAAGGIAAAGAIMSSLSRPALNLSLGKATFQTESVKGQADVTFLEFAALAQNKPVKVTGLTFAAYGDDDADFATVENDVNVLDHITSCSLYKDTTLIDGPEPIDGAGRLAFSPSLLVATTKATSLSVKCSLANTDLQGDNPDVFGLALISDTNVVAQDVKTGTALPAAAVNVSGATDPGLNPSLLTQNVTSNDHGTLSVTLSDDSPEGTIVLSGSTEVLLDRWTFEATGESFGIPRLAFKNTASTTPLLELQLRYTDSTGGMRESSLLPAADEVIFEGLSLEVGKTMDVELYANAIRPASSETSGGRIGYALDLNPDYSAIYSMTSGVTGEEAGVGTGLVEGAEFVVYATRPTFTLSSDSPSDAGIPGEHTEIFRFNVAADSLGDLSLRQLVFKVDATDNASSGWTTCGDGEFTGLADESRWDLALTKDPTDSLGGYGAWSFLNTSGKECSTESDLLGYVVLTMDDPLDILAGTTDTFSLSYNSMGASSTDNDSIRASISATDVLSAAHVWTLIWNDGYSDADETFVKNLPVSGNTITY